MCGQNKGLAAVSPKGCIVWNNYLTSKCRGFDYAQRIVIRVVIKTQKYSVSA